MSDFITSLVCSGYGDQAAICKQAAKEVKDGIKSLLGKVSLTGKSQGAAGCTENTPDQEPTHYYLTANELKGTALSGKPGIRTCTNGDTTLGQIPGFFENSAQVQFTQRNAGKHRVSYLSLNNYQKEVAKSILGKFISLPHSNTKLEDFANATKLRCWFSSNNNVALSRMALNTTEAKVIYSLQQAEETRITPPAAMNHIPPSTTGEITFTLEAPLKKVTLGNESYTVQKSFSHAAITLALACDSKAQIVDNSVSAAPDEQNKTVTISAKITVPGKEDQQNLGMLVVLYNGSEMLRFPLGDILTIGTPPVDKADKSKPILLTGIENNSARRGGRTLIKIKGINIPKDISLQDINNAGLVFSNIQVLYNNTRIEAYVAVDEDANLGQKFIRVLHGGKKLKDFPFFVLKKKPKADARIIPPDAGMPPDTWRPKPDIRPPKPKDPCAGLESMMLSACCKNHPTSPSCKTKPKPQPKPKPKVKDPCDGLESMMLSGCCQLNPTSPSCK